MGGGTPAPPPTPDPAQTAAVQANYNMTAGNASDASSKVNQFNPYGSLQYTQTGTGPGGVPLYTSNTTLAPDQQQLLDALTANKTKAGDYFGSLMGGATGAFDNANADLSNIPGVVNRSQNFMDQAQNALNFGQYGTRDPNSVIGDMTGGWMKDMIQKKSDYLNPYHEREVDQLDTKLRNQGLAPGNPAYTQAMDALKQSQDHAMQDFIANNEATTRGQAITQYGLPADIATKIAGLSTSELQQALPWLQAASAHTNLGGTQLNAAPGMLGASAPSMPSFMSTPGATYQPANYQGAVSTSADIAQKNYQSQLAQNQNMMSGLFGIGSNLLGGWAKSPTGSAAISGLFGL